MDRNRISYENNGSEPQIILALNKIIGLIFLILVPTLIAVFIVFLIFSIVLFHLCYFSKKNNSR